MRSRRLSTSNTKSSGSESLSGIRTENFRLMKLLETVSEILEQPEEQGVNKLSRHAMDVMRELRKLRARWERTEIVNPRPGPLAEM
jgi:hypothetical protein